MHNYKEYDGEGAPWPVGKVKLDAGVFHASRAHASTNIIGECASKQSKASWVSFSPASWVQQVSEQASLEHAHCMADWSALESSWLVGFFEKGLMVRKRNSVEWFFCLGAFGASGALGWPARIIQGMLGDEVVLDTQVAADDLMWLWVVDIDDWEAREVTWVSPLRRMVKTGSTSTDQLTGVLFEAPSKILEVAARKAFWRFGHTQLRVLASHIGASAGASVFETLVNLIRAILGDIGDEEMSTILEHRMALDQMTAGWGQDPHSTFPLILEWGTSQ